MKLFGSRYHLVWGVSAAALLFVFAVYRPETGKLTRLRELIDTQMTEVDAQTARLKTMMSLHEIVVRQRTELASFDAAVPCGQQFGGFLETVDRLAVEAGLSEKNVVPAKIIHKGEVYCLPLEVYFDGPFEAVYKFLRGVESLPRVARVQHMRLTSAEDDRTDLNSSLTVHVYFRSS